MNGTASVISGFRIRHLGGKPCINVTLLEPRRCDASLRRARAGLSTPSRWLGMYAVQRQARSGTSCKCVLMPYSNRQGWRPRQRHGHRELDASVVEVTIEVKRVDVVMAMHHVVICGARG